MKSNPIRFFRDARGQSLVEFALILPMMLVVMFMITEFGRAIFMYNVLAQAAREGARVAVVSGPASAIANGEARMTDFLTKARMNTGATVTCEIVNDYQGVDNVNVVVAKAERPFNWAFAGPMSMLGGGSAAKGGKASWTLHAEAVMKSETF
jgi:Flp pilus assembly protein TadG